MGESKGPILMEVTRRPQALRTTPMLLAVTPLPSPLTTPPVTNTYFISRSLGVVLSVRLIVAVVFVLMTEREMFWRTQKSPEDTKQVVRVAFGFSTNLSRELAVHRTLFRNFGIFIQNKFV